jgi:radical SAM protein with 4Fe4S-binding SPASM domain
MLPLPVLKRVVDDLRPRTEGVFLWGGETLQYPDLIPLVRYVKKHGKFCSLITNGTYLPKYARELVESGIDAVDVSLDAAEQTHDRLRGVKGTFRAALEGIRLLTSEREARGLKAPRVHISTVLLPETVGELPELIREVRDAGAASIILCRLQYTTAEQGKAHEAVFQELFQVTPTSWKGFAMQAEPDGAEKVRVAVEAILANPDYRGFVSWWEGNWSPTTLAQYYRDPTTAAPANRACGFPWDAVSICPSGDVSPCPDYPDVIVGNVHSKSFRAIWNGPKYREFRQHLAKRGRFPICSSCCQLYQ